MFSKRSSVGFARVKWGYYKENKTDKNMSRSTTSEATIFSSSKNTIWQWINNGRPWLTAQHSRMTYKTKQNNQRVERGEIMIIWLQFICDRDRFTLPTVFVLFWQVVSIITIFLRISVCLCVSVCVSSFSILQKVSLQNDLECMFYIYEKR